METTKISLVRRAHKNKSAKQWEPNLSEAVSYILANPQLLNQEVNLYAADKLMMMLDNEKLAALEDQFSEHPNGIALENFVLLLKSAIIHPEEDKYRLVNGLIRLFEDIDINGDGSMEWSEFTQYIIDAVIGEKDTKFFDARFEKDRELTENEILEKAYSRKLKRYALSKTTDNTVHQNHINRVQYSPATDLLLVLEQGNKELKFYNADCEIKHRIEPKFEEKAFIIDACYAHAINMVGVLTSDRNIYMYENNILAKRDIFKQKCDVLQSGIWYLENHKVWITAGADYALRTYAFGGDQKSTSIYDKALLASHTSNITDVAEIMVPKLVATSSLDGLIKLWDLTDKYVLAEVKDASTKRGVRGLTYSYDYGGNLLSYGFENHINVWCPEVSTSRPYVGRLEGHSSTIVSCRFVPGSPNCISFDEKGNLRIWDIRIMTTVQVITADQNMNILVHDISVMTKHDKIVLAGKRLTFFDNLSANKNMKNIVNDETVPIRVEYNAYFHTFIILTKADIRVYDAQVGKLRKVFTDIGDEKSDLSCMCFGARERKFYVGDNLGSIRSFNAKNGELLNVVTSLEDEEEQDKQRKAITDKINKDAEATDWDERLKDKKRKNLVSASKKEDRKSESRRERRKPKSLKDYIKDRDYAKKRNADESPDQQEEAQKHKETLQKTESSTANGRGDKGKRRENVEISHLIYSNEEKLLISSSWDSTIKIYDETDPQESQLLRIMSGGHLESDIGALDYSSHLSLIASGSGNSIISVWDFDSGRLESTCVGHNGEITALKFCKEYPILVSASTDCTVCVWGVRPCRLKYRYIAIVRLFNSLWSEEDEEKRLIVNSVVINTKHGPGIKREAVGTEFPTGAKYNEYIRSSKFLDLGKTVENKGKGRPKGATLQFNTASSEEKTSIVRKMEDIVTTEENCPEWIEFYEKPQDFRKYMEIYDSEVKQEKQRLYTYFADQKGYISVLYLDDMINRRDIQVLPEPWNSEKRAESYQFKRKDHIDVSKIVDTQLKNDKIHRTPFTAHAYNTVLVRRWQAHKGAATSLTLIEDPLCLVSCGQDKHVKLWSVSGELLGDINLGRLGTRIWKFPFDWIQHKTNEIDEVFDVLKKVERAEMEALTEQQKEKIRAKYLLGYFGPEKEMITRVSEEIGKKNNGSRDTTYTTQMKVSESAATDNTASASTDYSSGGYTWEKNQRFSGLSLLGSTQGDGNLELLNRKPELADYSDKTLSLLNDLKEIEQKHKKEQGQTAQKSLSKRVAAADATFKSNTSKMNSRGMSRNSMDTPHAGGTSKNTSPSKRTGGGTTTSKMLAETTTQGKAQMRSSATLKDLGTPMAYGQQASSERIEDTQTDRRVNERESQPREYEKKLESPKFVGRKLFHNFSAANFQRNQRYTTHLVKNNQKTYSYKEQPDDIKYKLGEGARALKMAVRSHIEKFEAESQKIYSTDNEPLIQRNEFYKSLRMKGGPQISKSKENASNISTQREGQNIEQYKILGNRLFMEDSSKNQPKFVQSTGKLYVLNT